MSIAFSHSLRALQADRNRFSLVALSLAGLLFLGWLGWFFFAPVTIYETGQIVQTSSDGVVIAHFPGATQARLKPGQTVQVQLTGTTPSNTIPATIEDVDPTATNNQIQVTIYANMDSPNAAALQNGLTGQATVAVEQTSPAGLVLRATGYGVDTPPVSLEAAQ